MPCCLPAPWSALWSCRPRRWAAGRRRRPVFPVAPDPPANLLALTNFLPLQPPANLKPSAPPNLAGSWLATPYQSISMADRPGAQRGKEKDIEYQPWALQRTLSEIPPTGPEARPEKTTDPWIRFCEPNGPLRAYAHPTRTLFLQLPDRVMMFHELMQTFRIIRLNSKHPPLEDLDPTAWGDSIGWYENGDTFVIDTIGLNGRAWLDQMGHPMTTKAHIIERYTLHGRQNAHGASHHRRSGRVPQADRAHDHAAAVTCPSCRCRGIARSATTPTSPKRCCGMPRHLPSDV